VHTVLDVVKPKNVPLLVSPVSFLARTFCWPFGFRPARKPGQKPTDSEAIAFGTRGASVAQFWFMNVAMLLQLDGAGWLRVVQGGAEWCRLVPWHIPHTERQDETVACIRHAYFVFLVQPFNIINLNMRARFMHTSLGPKGAAVWPGAWSGRNGMAQRAIELGPKTKCGQHEHVIPMYYTI